MLALIAFSVVLGALAQRITGMGFALVVSPLIPRIWRHIEWRTLAWLAVPGITTITVGLLRVDLSAQSFG